MSFLFPAAAWLGLLALPIIGFYLLKTRQRRQAVSTLLFWNELKPKIENSPFWRRLRRWLSLAVQLLVLGLLITALAKPAFEWEKKAPRRVVAIVDLSASMQAVDGGQSHWEGARKALLEAVARLRVQDEMTIVTMDEPPRILQGWSSSQRALREALEQAAPAPVGSDPRESFALASELQRLRDDATVVIYSDRVWPADVKEAIPEGARYHEVDGEPPTNVGLSLFAIRRSPIAPGDWQLDAELTTTSPFSGTLELRRDDVAIDLVPLKATPGTPWRKSWRGSSEAGALYSAALAGGDAFALDDRAQARLHPLEPALVVLVGEVDPFLETVLESIPLVRWVRLPTVPDPPPLGTRLIITHGAASPSKAPELAALLMIDPPGNGFWGERTGTVQNAVVAEVDAAARLLRHTGFGQVSISEAGRWKPQAGARVLVNGVDGPLIFGEWDRQPQWLVLGFAPANSDLMLRTAFPVFMGNLLQSLRVDHEGDASAQLPGQVESALAPVVEAEGALELAEPSWWPIFPGWWWVLLAACGLLLIEWRTFHRRLTD